MTIFCNLYSSPKLNVLIIQGHCPKIMLNINTKKHNDSVAHYIIYIISILDLNGAFIRNLAANRKSNPYSGGSRFSITVCVVLYHMSKI